MRASFALKSIAKLSKYNKDIYQFYTFIIYTNKNDTIGRTVYYPANCLRSFCAVRAFIKADKDLNILLFRHRNGHLIIIEYELFCGSVA